MFQQQKSDQVKIVVYLIALKPSQLNRNFFSALTQWSPFGEKTTYFAPSDKDFMINYRVDNLTALVVQLKKEGVTMVDSVETVDYGKFVHIMDNEGNKIELWEPNDLAYEKMGVKMGAKTTK